jgi:DNA-binding FadR family transcriptional regulator
MAAEKITNKELAKLQETIDTISNSKDNNYGEADKEFHRIIALSANNPIVEGMIDSLLVTHHKIDSLIQYRERDLTVEYHQAIYSALESHNPQEAFIQMYNHLDYVRQKVLQHSRIT